MKIFIVCNSLGAGGAERVGVNLANGFAQHGHQAYIITDIYQKASYPVNNEVKVLPLCPKDKGKIQRWTEAIINMRRYVKQEHPDVIIGIMHLCSVVARLATIGTKVPVVMTIHHALESDTYKFSKIEQFLDRHTPNFYKATTVLTHPDKECLGGRKKIFVMPNPVTFAAVKELPHKEKVILAAGRLNDWQYKGWDVLLNAWKSLQKCNDNVSDNDNFKDWWLKIAGAGNIDSINYLKSLIPDAEWTQNDNVNDDDNHLNTKHTKEKETSAEKQNTQKSGIWRSEKYHIEFLGYRTDMEQLFQKASIFALSSRSEGLPMVLIEAMSQGCAPIATDFKGRTKEIITSEKEGLTCEPEDIEALAEGIQKLMNDEELRKTIQQNAIERSKFYSLDHIIEMWERLFRTLL